MQYKNFLALTLIVQALSGCANTPAVHAQYYLPKAQTSISVSQTLGCDKNEKVLAIATSVSPSTSYPANLAAPHSISYAGLSNAFVDADTTINLTSDGRLIGINASSTGQGGAIVKGAIALATAIAPLALYEGPIGQKHPPKPTTIDFKAVCDIVQGDSLDKSNGTGGGGGGGGGSSPTTKTVVVTYNIEFEFALSDCLKPDSDIEIQGSTKKLCLHLINRADHRDEGSTLAMVVQPDSEGVYKDLVSSPSIANSLTPNVQILSAVLVLPGGQPDAAVSAGDPHVTLSQVATVQIGVLGFSGKLDKSSLWTGTVRVPLSDPGFSSDFQYDLPIPKAALFGKEQFGLSLADDGSVTKLEYGQNSGAGDALGAAAALVQALHPTTAQDASEIQAQSDLIYQQHRRVICKTEPSNCPSK